MRLALPTILLACLCVPAAPVLAHFPTPVPGSALALKCVDVGHHRTPNNDRPAPVAADLPGDGKRLAFRTCRDWDGNTHYFMREPRRNRAGVCRSVEREIFPGSARDMVRAALSYDPAGPVFALAGWKDTPPAAWAKAGHSNPVQEFGLVATADCPTGNDQNYVLMFNVSDAVFKSFNTAWEELSRSPDALRAATYQFRPVMESASNAGWMTRRFNDFFITGVAQGRYRLTRVYCGNTGCGASVGSGSVLFTPAPGGGVVITDIRP
jgi:hypothetical protein